MDVKALQKDFLTWSGGFPPDSEEQITVYVDTAQPIDDDSEMVRSTLRTWMLEDN